MPDPLLLYLALAACCLTASSGVHISSVSVKLRCLGQHALACSGLKDGNYQSCDTCNAFVMCSGGRYHLQPCAPSNPPLQYDSDKNRCEYTSPTCANPIGAQPQPPFVRPPPSEVGSGWPRPPVAQPQPSEVNPRPPVVRPLPAEIRTNPPVVRPPAVTSSPAVGECGISKYPDAANVTSTRIVGGVGARPHEFPWMVSVRDHKGHACGASIINSRWVLTAAHCLYDEDKERIPLESITLAVGEHDRSSRRRVSSIRLELRPSAYFIHESYRPTVGDSNDIALFKLATAIAFNENVRPVCFPDPRDLYTNSPVVVSGWGSTAYGAHPSTYPSRLRYARLRTMSNDRCSNWFRDELTPDMICAAHSTQDACQGDSGGPLVVRDGSGRFRQVGVVSWGNGCAEGYPGVYARVGHFIDWIKTKISNAG